LQLNLEALPQPSEKKRKANSLNAGENFPFTPQQAGHGCAEPSTPTQADPTVLAPYFRHGKFSQASAIDKCLRLKLNLELVLTVNQVAL